jgi:transcriptional regulator with XRE-family HTH domain
MNHSAALGHCLKRARQAKGLTLRAVEKATGISNPYLSQLESGRISKPSPNNLHKLSELYGLPYATVMEKAGYPVPESSDEHEQIRFLARLGPTTEDEQEELLGYLEFLRLRRRRRDA